LAFGKSVERALGYFISFFASLVMIVIAYYVAGIDFTKIFSVLEIMSSLKANVLMFTLGMGLYYELKVIFGRFASVFNLENVSMVHVDTLKKETVQSP
jgi:glycerol-3-phosphate acyltransferase PlsY